MTRLARWLRTLADRIDHAGAPKAIGWSFHFVEREGIQFVEDPIGNREPRGCPLWYLGDEDYARAFLSDPPARLARDAPL